jgi:GDP-L-fucose synthase
MYKTSKIYIAGHTGMVGSALMRKLTQEGYSQLITRTYDEVDLRDQQAVANFFSSEKPEYVFLAAAKVGGIVANNLYRADFIYDNLMMEANIIHQSYLNGVKKLLFLGSSCIYPKLASQPLKEEYLLSGYLEPTNQSYAIAKIAGIELCNSYHEQYGCDFISLMPTNLYGPNDNYDLEKSHVLPALLRKFITAVRTQSPIVELWGTGTPRREFLHVDDLASACLFLMLHYDQPEILNIGTGEDIPIKELALLIQQITGYTGEIIWNKNKPDGTPRKLMDVSRVFQLGWRPTIQLEDGILQLYKELKDASWDY